MRMVDSAQSCLIFKVNSFLSLQKKSFSLMGLLSLFWILAEFFLQRHAKSNKYVSTPGDEILEAISFKVDYLSLLASNTLASIFSLKPVTQSEIWN